MLTGTDPAFCAAVDLKKVQREGLSYFERYQSHNCITKVAEMATPVMARSTARFLPVAWRWHWGAIF